MKRPARTSPSRPWLEVVQLVKSAYARDRWRLAVLPRIDGWREVAVAWSGATELRTFGLRFEAPAELDLTDDLYEWAWDMVSIAAPACVRSACRRSVLSDAHFVEVFMALRGVGLLFPDGTIADSLSVRMQQDLAVKDLSRSVEIARLNKKFRALQPKEQSP